MRPAAMGRVAALTSAQRVEQVLYNLYGKGKTARELQPLGHAHADNGRLLHCDAVGLCGLLSLHMYYDQSHGFLQRAEALAEAVHSTLAKNRRMQLGVKAGTWLGEASEEEPLLGGLRSGKVMGEDRPQGDGQVWHSLMLWAFALNRLSAAGAGARYNLLAAQLLMGAAPRFLVKGLPDPDPEAAPAAPADASAEPGVTLCPRMSIDLSRPLPGRRRATDPLVGAFICGLVRAGLGPQGDRPVVDSLERLERRLAALWQGCTDGDLQGLRADPMQIGDALWVAAWARRRPWAAAAREAACRGLGALCAPPSPFWERPMQGRYPPAELWMVCGARAAEAHADLPVKVDDLDVVVEQLAVRMSLWGPLALALYGPALIGGVYVPDWLSQCTKAAAEDRNDRVGRRVTHVDDSVLGGA